MIAFAWNKNVVIPTCFKWESSARFFKFLDSRQAGSYYVVRIAGRLFNASAGMTVFSNFCAASLINPFCRRILINLITCCINTNYINGTI